MEIKALLNNKGMRAALIVFVCIIIIFVISMCQKRHKDEGNEPLGSTEDVFGNITLPNGLTIDDNFSFTAKESATAEQEETIIESKVSESDNETNNTEFSGDTNTTKVDYAIDTNEFKINIEKDFKYSIRDERAVIDCYLGNEKNVKVPAELRRYSVIAIGNGAFSGIGSKACQSINSVEIASGVERIENKAFSSCVNLNYIKIPASVDFIGEFAFENCPNLVIRCSSASYARKYAIEKDINYMD